jgi:type III secretion protein L
MTGQMRRPDAIEKTGSMARPDVASREDSPDRRDLETPQREAPPQEPGPIRLLRSPGGTGDSIRALFEPRDRRLVRREVLSEVTEVQRELAEARAEAEAIVDAAREEADAIREQARREGLADGHREALEVLGHARAEYDALMSRAEPDMVELAFRIARSVIGTELQREPDTIARIVANQLEHVRGRRQVVIVVHPEDRPRLEAYEDQLAQLVEGAALYIDDDRDIEPGGCIIQTESGRIDARLDVQLEALRGGLGSP